MQGEVRTRACMSEAGGAFFCSHFKQTSFLTRYRERTTFRYTWHVKYSSKMSYHSASKMMWSRGCKCLVLTSQVWKSLIPLVRDLQPLWGTPQVASIFGISVNWIPSPKPFSFRVARLTGVCRSSILVHFFVCLNLKHRALRQDKTNYTVVTAARENKRQPPLFNIWSRLFDLTSAFIAASLTFLSFYHLKTSDKTTADGDSEQFSGSPSLLAAQAKH